MSKYQYHITWLAEIDPMAMSRRFEDPENQLSPRSFTYTYSGRPIDVSFSPKVVTLYFEKASLLKPKSERNLINDILEKIYIIYTILYSTGFAPYRVDISLSRYDGIKKAWIPCELPEDTYLTRHNLTADFMVNGIFTPDVTDFDTDTWKSDEWISSYLSKRSHDFTFEQKNLKSALYAWIVSKNKTIPGERFQYLWIAFNCLYFYFARTMRQRIVCEVPEEMQEEYRRVKTERASPNTSNISEDDLESVTVYSHFSKLCTDEREALENYAELMMLPKPKLLGHIEASAYDWHNTQASKNEIERHHRKTTGDKVIDAINECWDGAPVTLDSLKERHHELAEKIAKYFKTSDDMEKQVYRYLLVGFLYNNLRCQMFHGSMPIPLYSPAEDKYRKAFELANGMLEDQLVRTLFKNFTRDIKGAPDKEEADLRLSTLCPDNLETVRKIAKQKASGIEQSIKDIKKQMK